jgi:hypothetical protein
MSSTDAGSAAATETAKPGTIDMRLEVVMLPVSDGWLLQEITARLPGRVWED